MSNFGIIINCVSISPLKSGMMPCLYLILQPKDHALNIVGIQEACD